MTINPQSLYPSGAAAQTAATAAFTDMAASMQGSRILGIAAQVEGMIAEGCDICNLTVGDFNPKHFPIPESLSAQIGAHLTAGQTNYPPADGMPELRKAIAAFYARELGVAFPVESVVVGSGARPPIYAAYKLFLDPGDTLTYAIPSWNNEYYAHLNQTKVITVQTAPEQRFMPTLAQLAPHLQATRVLHLNSPLNPCGTCIEEKALREICEAIVAENRRREATGEKSLMLLFDMVYWLLTFGEKHAHPIGVCPEIAPYTVYVDAISKAFAGTGLRVGWGVVPPYLQGKFKALIGHMGAWAPRPVQLATADFLDNPAEMHSFLNPFRAQIKARLDCIYETFKRMEDDGVPVSAIPPQGAIYLSVHCELLGKTQPNGSLITSDEDMRLYLLQEARVAVVPFRAFGMEGETGWFRMSVGAVSQADLEAAMARLEAAIRRLC
jgi:aspartate aminotransferase